MRGHDYDEMARRSAVAVEAERRRSRSTEPREWLAREMPHDPEDDRGPQLIAALGGIVLVLFAIGLVAAVVLIRKGGQ